MTLDKTTQVFYLTDTSATSGGKQYYFTSYALSSDGTLGTKLTFLLDTTIPAGTTVKKGKEHSCTISYVNPADGLIYKVDGYSSAKASYTIVMRVCDTSGAPHVEGDYTATLYNSGSKKTLSVSGSFNFTYGENIPEVRTLYEAKKNGCNSSSVPAGSSDISIRDSELARDTPDKLDFTCRSCNGTGNCRNCGGDGLYYNVYTYKTVKCGICHGTGNCQTCYGTGREAYGHY